MSPHASSLGPKPGRSRLRIGIATTLFTVYFAFVLWVVLSPQLNDAIPVNSIAARLLRALHAVGVPEGFGFNELEFVANIGMFVPLGFLLGLALPGWGWWLALILLPLSSVGIEWFQGEYLPGRVSDARDVIANSAGAWIGTFIAAMLRGMVHARDRKVLRRALWEQQRHAAWQREQAAASQPRVVVAQQPVARQPQQRIAYPQQHETLPPTRIMPQVPPEPTYRPPQDPHDAPTERLNF